MERKKHCRKFKNIYEFQKEERKKVRSKEGAFQINLLWLVGLEGIF